MTSLEKRSRQGFFFFFFFFFFFLTKSTHTAPIPLCSLLFLVVQKHSSGSERRDRVRAIVEARQRDNIHTSHPPQPPDRVHRLHPKHQKKQLHRQDQSRLGPCGVLCVIEWRTFCAGAIPLSSQWLIPALSHHQTLQARLA